MNKYKVNINKPKPSDQEIEQFKDFDNIANSYGKIHRPWYALKDLYKDRKLIRIVIIVIALGLAIYVSHQALTHSKKDSPDKKDTPTQNHQGCIESPFSRISES